ncbi:MAG: hypothetical protein RL095_258 [Verrucomicrobiota bacterium]|jgi:type I restriction enzyme R subunit
MIRFQEEYSSKIPALALLSQLGWSFLSPDQALAARSGKTHEVVLREVLRGELRQRRFPHAGGLHALSEAAIDDIINHVATPPLNEGLGKANETLSNALIYGVSTTVFVEGKKLSPTIPLIDWEKPENNRFHFTEEFCLLRSGGIETRRPDIVCFVNGLPLAVIEAKRPDGHAGRGPTVEEGISQHLRNQRPDEIPHLYAYSQILMSINGAEGRYGTQGTATKFWAVWAEEDFSDSHFHRVKNSPLSAEQLVCLFGHRKAGDRDWYQELRAGGELAVTDQDRLIISLLSPQRLLEMTRFYTLFDKKAGKIVARHQQVFGIKRLIERVCRKSPGGAREGGVIWHTTGSGKSFTMVLLSKALIFHPALKQCRLIVVTDRVDLETQLSRSFASGGELSKKDQGEALASTGKRLAEQIGSGSERIIFTLVQKFNTATKLPECKNDSSDIIVLVDEGHRSQGGENHERMKLALPKAAFVAFTGTPLLKEDKTTGKFGSIVHAYTMQRAVADQTVTPLLYEERVPDLEVNERAIDTWFERITTDLTSKQKSDLKQKFAKKGQIYAAEDRIRLIALDIADHLSKNIEEPLKGQLACDSKLAAIQYKRYLDEAGLFESAVVISAPDTREGNTEVDESAQPEVSKWWKDNVGNKDESDYAKEMIKRFEEDPALRLLIVVDKLLTGFDEPLNSVLYIDKPLKEHNLLQAIARVNRLHEKKKFGLLIDYRGILSELDTTLAKYQDLAARTLGGFDAQDLEGLYQQMSSEYKRLPRLHDQVWSFFKAVKNKQDIEQLRQVLVPQLEEVDLDGRKEMVDRNQKVRDDFYAALTEFGTCLKVALQSASFFADKSFSDADRNRYKETLKVLSSLRQLARRDAGETISYEAYAPQIKKLLDKHVIGIEVCEPEGVYEVGRMGKPQKLEDWSESKTRNETDIIKSRLPKKIEQDLRDDPYAQEAFSKMLREVIEEAKKLFEHPLKQYMLFREFEEKVQERQAPGVPVDRFQGQRLAQSCYGVFKMSLLDSFGTIAPADEDHWVKLAKELEGQIDQAVAENSLNPQNIEAAIRKSLLPRLFAECKAKGAGMDHAKAMVDKIVQITRSGKAEK